MFQLDEMSEEDDFDVTMNDNPTTNEIQHNVNDKCENTKNTIYK